MQKYAILFIDEVKVLLKYLTPEQDKWESKDVKKL